MSSSLTAIISTIFLFLILVTDLRCKESLANARERKLQTHLWSKIKPQIANAQIELDQQGYLARETDLDLIREVCRLAKVDQVLEGERKRDGFGQRNRNVLFGLVDAGVRTDGNHTTSDITFAREFNAFLGSVDFD